MNQPSADDPVVFLSPRRKLAATFVVMLATILVVLDQTIANVALPHMQASLGATPETISWVLTSYILATGIGTPVTGWLSGRIGRTRLFGIATIGFTVSSAMCGLSVSLPMIVFARVLQGFFGAFLMPMSQAIMYDLNPPSQQVRAMTIWGLGVMVAPLVGPVLGGYLTEILDWRWVFFINVPLGALAAFGIFAILPDLPSARRAFDHIGFLMIAAALCGLQLALDRGTQQDWLESPEIVIELGVSAGAFWLLFFHLRRSPHPLIPTTLFANRNFVAATLLCFIVGPILLASAALLPPLVQTLMGYPVFTAGLILIPRGLAMAIAMVLGGRLMSIIDGRLQILLGVALLALSLHLQTRFSLGMDTSLLIWSGALQGAGMGLAVMTMNYLAVSSLPIELRTEGAAVYNLVRSVGASLMIALASAMLARNLQINHSEIGSSINPSSLPFLITKLFGGVASGNQVAAMLNAEVTRQALMVAYIDDFAMMMWLTLAALPLIVLIRPVRPRRGEIVTVVE